MRKLSKLTCTLMVTAGLSANAFAAGDTEKGQTPRRPPPLARTINPINLQPQS